MYGLFSAVIDMYSPYRLNGFVNAGSLTPASCVMSAKRNSINLTLVSTELTHPPPPKQCGRNSTDDIFKCIFMIQICVFWSNFKIDNKAELFQVMIWRRTRHKPLPETMLIQFTDGESLVKAFVANTLFNWWKVSTGLYDLGYSL